MSWAATFLIVRPSRRSCTILSIIRSYSPRDSYRETDPDDLVIGGLAASPRDRNSGAFGVSANIDHDALGEKPYDLLAIPRCCLGRVPECRNVGGDRQDPTRSSSVSRGECSGSSGARVRRMNRIKDRDKIIKAAERILGKNHGQRYHAYKLNADGTFEFSECKSLSHEKRIEGKYVIATAEKSLDVLEAVAIYKDLADVERGFRQLKDVLALRPIYHQVEPRVRAHIFVAALALLVQRLLDRRLREAGIEFSSPRAMEALSTVRHVAVRVNGEDKHCGVAGGSPDARRVLKALKIGDLRPPTPADKSADTIM